MGIQLLRNTFLIRADKDLNTRLKIKGHNDQPLFLDTDFQKYQHATQFGQIAHIPLSISQEYINDVKLNVGDTVVFHHFVCQPDNLMKVPGANGGEFYKCEYYNLWCTLKGANMQPIEDFIFVEPILEPENALRSSSGLLHMKRDRQKMKNTGIVFAVSKSAKEKGVRMGDRVFFTNDADYEIKIIDKDFYRMRLRNIIAVERDGKLMCLSDKMIVKEIPMDQKFESMQAFRKDKIGVVVNIGAEIKGVAVGDEISYFNIMNTSIGFDGEFYSLLTTEQVNYKMLNK